MEVLRGLVDEINRLRANPAAYVTKSPELAGLVQVETEAMDAIEEREEMTAAAQACCTQLRSALALDQVQLLQEELRKQGVWLGTFGHCLFPLQNTSQHLLFSMLIDHDIPYKGRKFNLLSPHFTACGLGLIPSSPPMGLLVLAGEFFPRYPQSHIYNKDRQHAGADRVIEAGWPGSVMALTGDKDLFHTITSHIETDLPEHAVAMKTRTTVLRRNGTVTKRVQREYQMRDGTRVTEWVEA